jgi:hypothetical protein
MNKRQLIESAARLPRIGSESLAEFSRKSGILLARMNASMLGRPDILDLVGGEANFTTMTDNHQKHLRFVYAVMAVPNPGVLVETVLWVFRAYTSRGFKPQYWAAQMQGWNAIFQDELSETCRREIKPLYDWLADNVAAFDACKQESADAEPAHLPE